MDDFPPTAPMPDRLELMWHRQLDVIDKIQQKQKRLGRPFLPISQWGEINDSHTAREITENLNFCVEELVEAMRELPARKPWKQNVDPADFSAFVKEMGDALAFFLEACIFAGMNSSDLYNTFLGISDKNVERASGDY